MKGEDFDMFSDLIIKNVIPRLLVPLQDNGRVLKPCLLHGDCWDGRILCTFETGTIANSVGNTAMDTRTGEAFVFGLSSFYGHNEYDIGNWRAPRHRLSNKAFITAYKRRYPVSEPERDWDWRNLLYSLIFNICNATQAPGSSEEEKEAVIADMQTLCLEFCPDEVPLELKRRTGRLHRTADIYQWSADSDDDEEEDRGSEAGSVSGSRILTKPRFLGPDFRSMAEALDDDRMRDASPRLSEQATDIFDAS